MYSEVDICLFVVGVIVRVQQPVRENCRPTKRAARTHRRAQQSDVPGNGDARSPIALDARSFVRAHDS